MVSKVIHTFPIKPQIPPNVIGDDAALFSSTLEEISQALTVFDEEAKKLGLQFDWDKTELMLVGYGTEPQPLTFDGFQVRFVSQFRYLGSTIAGNGSLRPVIAR